MDYSKTKFNFLEAFNNTSGKTSGSAIVGLFMGITATFAFIAGVVGWFLEVELIIEYFNKVLELGGLSALLMGIRKVSGIFNKN